MRDFIKEWPEIFLLLFIFGGVFFLIAFSILCDTIAQVAG